MRSFIAVLALVCLCEARPSVIDHSAKIGFGRLGIDNFIIGGSDANPGAWPWQLSQQRQGATWSHSCGASLLTSTRALSAAHCLDGSTPSNIRVIAGLHQRSDTTGTQTAAASSLVMHERYQQDSASFSNDIAIIHLASSINTGGNVGFATLPPSGNMFTGVSCTMSGWGRTSASNALPDTLQQANIDVISTAQCQSLMSSVNGASIWDAHICLYDNANNIGSCNGDSGGPLNCPDGAGGYYVAGVTSWGISNILGNCLQTYPSVYTRTTSYLSWISSH